jgi:hypothetical protein
MSYVNTPQVRAIIAGLIAIMGAAWLPAVASAAGLPVSEVASVLAAGVIFAGGGLVDLATERRKGARP